MKELLSVLSSTLQGGLRGGLLFLALLATTTLWAYDFQSGDLYYDIISNNEPYTVEVASNDGQYSGDITIPETVENNGITYSVTRIGDEAFGNCLALTSITIPNSVTSIGGHAFISCYALTSIIIPDSVISIGSSAFSSCMSLTSISLPSNLMTIQQGTFSECTSLKSITLGENITTIEDHAFVRCDLEEIYVSALTPPILGRLVFDSSPTCYIPCGASAAYKATTWKDYVKCFVEECKEDSTWEIFYTSTDGNIVIPYESNIFDANIVSNTYSNGQGVITFDGPITRIDDYAFMFCESLASIIIPYGVISIGKAAFAHCSALTSITISNSVTTIGEEVFYYCESLDSIIIPNSVTSIGSAILKNCPSVVSIHVEEGNAMYDSRENCNAIIRTEDNTLISGCQNTIIPNSVTSISNEAFCGCSYLTSISIPNGITYIGDYAFKGCSSLTSIKIPKSVISIQTMAFSNCPSITSITVEEGNTVFDSRENCNAIIHTKDNTLEFGCQNTIIPNSVTSIEDEAFYGCSSLTSIVIPNSVTDIGSDAFEDCTSLTSVVLPDSITRIRTATFYNCTSLASIIIPNSVTSIGKGAFYYCSSLTSMNLPNNVTSIEFVAFAGCSSLTSIIIPNGVTHIERGTFSLCTSLTSITIPNSVTNIGEAAFYQCYSIDTIYCYATTPPDIKADSFDYYSNPTLYVPCDALEDYQAHSIWGRFANIDCIASEEVETQETVVDPSTNEVTITWPIEANAATYTIVIQSGNEVICTLRFNAQGQLLTIAYAPGRDGNNHGAQYAEQTAKGYRFTVTGLEQGTHYTYDITVQDANNHTILSHTGEFTTESMTAVDDITTNDKNTQKLLRDNQLYIYHNGSAYTIMGAELQ